MTEFASRSEQQEMIALLCEELASYSSNDQALPPNPGAWAQQCDHLQKAMDMVGLAGLSSVCHWLHENFETLAASATKARAESPTDALDLSTESLADLTQWPKRLRGYLQTFTASRADAGDALLDYLSGPVWPLPLSSESRAALARELADFEFSTATAVDDLPLSLTEDMLSLLVPADVAPQLLEGLLTELPEQVRSFESNIHNFLESRSSGCMVIAQRMAHTIKGAANVVGIAGLANLMHYCEDLLEHAALQEDLPQGFDEVLLRAADCLAASSEHLNGVGPAPEDLASVLQDLIATIRELKGIDPPVADLTSGDSLEGLEGLRDLEALPDLEGFDELEFDDLSDTDWEELEISLDGLEQLAEFSDSEIQPDSVAPTPPASTGVNPKGVNPCVNPHDSPPVIAASLPTNDPTAASEPSMEDVSMPSLQAERLAKTFGRDPAQSPAAISTEESSYHRLQLPESTAHELLRVAGESQIAGGQLEAQVVAMRTSVRVSDSYHQQLKAMASELGTLVQTRAVLDALADKAHEGMDPLELERYSELHSFSQQLLELVTDSFEGVSQLAAQIEELSDISYRQKQLNRANQDMLLELRLVAVGSLSSRLQRCVRQAARLTGKKAQLQIDGAELMMDSKVLNKVAAPLMHLLRNAVDHGLEAEEESRTAAGKAAEGVIQLSFEHRGETIAICCRDDGRGLDHEAIRQQAMDLGLLAANETVDLSTIAQLIFLPNFSTRKDVSQTSGRGIGLDAVYSEIQQLNGSITVDSEAGLGCCFTITVPTSILTVHALVVELAAEEGRATNRRHKATTSFSLTTQGIEKIVYLEGAERDTVSAGQSYFDGDNELPVIPLAALTGLGQPATTPANLLILRKADGQRLAIGVDTIRASQELVVKPLNSFCHRPPGVIGATILGSGAVSPVIDLHKLPGVSDVGELGRIREVAAQRSAARQAQEDGKALVLIVDDSLSVRRSLAQFVEDLGMESETARDGFEAITALESRQPTLVLVDLEMPRMNGLELTAHLRAQESTRQLPILMITSRSADKHRQLAQRAGVSGYLNKPWSDDDLLLAIRQYVS